MDNYPSSDADVESDTSSTSSGSVVQCRKCGGTEDADSAGEPWVASL